MPKASKLLIIVSLSCLISCVASAKRLPSAENKSASPAAPAAKPGLASFANGVNAMKAQKPADAEKAFTQALDEHVAVADYAHLERAQARRAQNKIAEAREDLEAALESKSSHVQNEARYQLLDLLIQQKAWKLVAQHAALLRKRVKNTDRYPDVLVALLLSEKKLHGKTLVCKTARELYAKYPTLPALKDWTQHLETNLIDGEKIGCTASAKDFKTRLRRLQLGGDPDRAVKELGGAGSVDDEDSDYGPDSILANHMIGEGQMGDAFKLLLKHYDTENGRPPYLMLLGKAATRSGDYDAAIAAYDRAYAMAPGGKRATEALFQAAFTSYQIQDYDGATRRFEQLVKKGRGTRWTRDARWYLAWMRYLRADYQGAYDGFKVLAREKPVRTRRHRRRVMVASESVSTERLRYWSGVSLLKLGRTQEGVTELQSLARDPSLGFYAILAYYRLSQTPGATLPPGLEVRLGLKKSDATAAAPTAEEVKAAAEAVQAQAEDNSVAANSVAAAESTKVAPDDSADSESDSDENDVADDDESESFQDQALDLRFDRVRDLIYVGLVDAARDELSDIERRARRTEDRKHLMGEYEVVKNFYRASVMGEMGFAAERLSGGLKGDSRKLWEYAYPKAWEDDVQKAAKSTSVPQELIWGIMRAESHYRTDAQSAVGALGLMQLMPSTGRKVADLMSVQGFETRTLLEADTNIKLGSRYLQRLVDKFSGSVPLVAAAYNAGPHRVHAWVRNFGGLEMDEFIEHIPFVETRNYVKKVVRNYQMYSWLYGGGSRQSLSWLVQPVGIRLEGPVPTKEIW